MSLVIPVAYVLFLGYVTVKTSPAAWVLVPGELLERWDSLSDGEPCRLEHISNELAEFLDNFVEGNNPPE